MTDRDCVAVHPHDMMKPEWIRQKRSLYEAG